MTTISGARGKRTMWAAVLAGIMLLTPAAALAQVAGPVKGHVSGPGGVAAPGATVTLVDKQTGERKVTWTDEEGNYTISGVKSGVYKLEISLIGFRTETREPVQVSAGQGADVNLQLSIAVPEAIPTPARRQRRQLVPGFGKRGAGSHSRGGRRPMAPAPRTIPAIS